MGKSLFIAEKPSVALEFAKALDMKPGEKKNGYLEDERYIVTWCVGHLVTLSYPDKYDERLKKWELETLPFIPKEYKYEVIPEVAAQYKVVKILLNRKDVDRIYYSGDSAREGEYIQRLVRQMAGHNKEAKEFRVWIDSQTREEIRNGIKNAHELAYYDKLSDSAYARAIEDYLVGIDFSRVLSIKYANMVSGAAGIRYTPIAVGRVMSCVLGMIVERERQIRSTAVIPYYGIRLDLSDTVSADWKIRDGSAYAADPDRYNDAGLLKKEKTEALIKDLSANGTTRFIKREKKQESKAAPLLFNLAELQAECTKQFHISPADTLKIAQTLYEGKLTTYPRTDARVLTTAICKVFDKNIRGLQSVEEVAAFSKEVLDQGMQEPLRQKTTKYVDDSKVSDHYAIIPTGEGFETLKKLSQLEKDVYLLICRRFLSIFYPPAVYDKLSFTCKTGKEEFDGSYTAVAKEGYLKVAGRKDDKDAAAAITAVMNMPEEVSPVTFDLKEGKSKPPKRYTTGSMILAMENAGKLIEDEALREQIKGSGIGTSATRAETISKLERLQYIAVNKKTQTITPDKLGEMVYDVLRLSVPTILKPDYTASWETGLQGIADGKYTKQIYLDKIYAYIAKNTENMKAENHAEEITKNIQTLKKVYPDIGKAQPADASGAGNTAAGTCPVCGKPLRISEKSIYCSGYQDGCKFTIWREISGKKLTDKQLESLAKGIKKNGSGGYQSAPSAKISGFKSKKGTSFDAKLQVTGIANGKVEIKFVFENAPKKP